MTVGNYWEMNVFNMIFLLIGKKKIVIKKAENAEKVRAAKEAKESLARLKLLESQR